MKTYRHLYPQVHDFVNLHVAFRMARRGKRTRPEVAAFEYDLEANLLQLQAELATQTYQPGPYRNFYVRERSTPFGSAAGAKTGVEPTLAEPAAASSNDRAQQRKCRIG